ncbi:Hypothetical protein A7982_04593 [Minicystis rosea]|nr:Hypothetical protein A7982_04593 [Minicystis rosea]
MNVAPVPHVGARVLVTWTDGRTYPATIVALAQGYAQVRWDAGGAPQWVPLHALAPLVTPAQPMPGIAPAPVGWNAHPQYAPASSVVREAPVSQQAAQPAQPSIAANAATSSGAAPRPTAGSIRDLPRGLIYEPTGSGPGNGKVFFFLFGFISTLDVDVAMRMTDIEHIGDDVAALRAAGYRVIVDLHGDLATLDAALTGKYPDAGGAPTAGVFWGGHGDDDGTIATHDGGWIAPEQISADVAQQGTVKLFVMSACHQGSHTSRWQKAIGPQAQIIGWGAPITNQRAIEFLVPDDANAKGFDDLLEKHLGVRRTIADGPLVEVKELAQKHEDRVATLLLPLEELATEAQKRLKCTLEKGKASDAWYLEVRTPPSKDYPKLPRSQVVRVSTMGAGDAWVHISSLVGPYSDALDLARGMRAVGSAIHIRVALVQLAAPDGEFVIVETILRRRRLDPYTFANNVSSVGTFADKLEDMFFGSDKR